jgi:hypothetical protein
MAYCIIEVRHKEYPNAEVVSAALAPLGLSYDELLSAFKTYICPLSPSAEGGYGAGLAADIKDYLGKALERDGLRASRSGASLAYSRSLKEHADFALTHDRTNKGIFFEIAFRHRYERDLLKFQIGHNEGTLAAAVMVLAVDPKTIDASMTTIPSYDAVIRMVDAIQPAYPLVVIGLRGSHAA